MGKWGDAARADGLLSKSVTRLRLRKLRTRARSVRKGELSFATGAWVSCDSTNWLVDGGASDRGDGLMVDVDPPDRDLLESTSRFLEESTKQRLS